MKRVRHLIVCTMLTAVGCSANADPYQTTVPPGSALVLSSQSNASDDAYVHFNGSQRIAGRFRFEYNVDSPYWVNPFMLFFPDAETVDLLPYLTERGAPERPQQILIENPIEAANALLGRSLAEDLNAGRLLILEGVATIVIDQYSAGFECDAPQFVARFVRAEGTAQLAEEGDRSVHGC